MFDATDGWVRWLRSLQTPARVIEISKSHVMDLATVIRIAFRRAAVKGCLLSKKAAAYAATPGEMPYEEYSQLCLR